MITHADSETACEPIEKDGGNDSLPTREEERRHRADVKEGYERRVDAVDAAFSFVNNWFNLHISAVLSLAPLAVVYLLFAYWA